MSLDPLAKVFAAASATGINDKRQSNLRPFPPGQSGNPGGRKKKGKYAKFCEKFVKSPEGRKLLKHAFETALKGGGMAAMFAARELGERESGRVTQELDISTTIQGMSEEELNKKLQKLIA